MNDEQLSNCHQAPVKLSGRGDFNDDHRAVTMYYVCSECKQACDLYVSNNNQWLTEILAKHVQDIKAGHEHLIAEQILQKISETLKDETHRNGKKLVNPLGCNDCGTPEEAFTRNELRQEIKAKLGLPALHQDSSTPEPVEKESY